MARLPDWDAQGVGSLRRQSPLDLVLLRIHRTPVQFLIRFCCGLGKVSSLVQMRFQALSMASSSQRWFTGKFEDGTGSAL